jgi:hypothetical protein
MISSTRIGFSVHTMVRWPAGRCRIDAVKPEVAEFQRIDEHIDRPNRIALVDPIIEAFRQQSGLLAIRPLNETLHRFPRRFSKRIIASMGFSHSLFQQQTRCDCIGMSVSCQNRTYVLTATSV